MWYQIELVRAAGHSRICTYRVHIKFWHPGFWIEAYRSLRDADATVVEALYFTAVLIAVIAKRKK